jgi:hypothetical protein
MPKPFNLDSYHRQRRASVEAFNRSRLGLGDPDAKASILRRQFRRISRKYERAHSRRRILRRLTCMAGVAALVLALLSVPVTIAAYRWDWPLATTTRHFLAWPNCGAAREVGLAPAFRGTPGYWPHHDADKDGIACEPLPRWKRN